MKNLIKLLSLTIASGLLITSCEGPMGPSGTNGANGLNGVDANSACLTCHNNVTQDSHQAQYVLSKHFFGTSSARNTKFCARCHTNEGFKEITGDGKFVVANDIPMGTRISCETCHKHRSFEFSGDTATFILRTNSPIYLNYYNNLTTQDFGKINNLCCTCHQIRGVTATQYTDASGKKQAFNQLPFFPLDETKNPLTDSVKFQIGTNFAVHDGNQSNLFSGINAYEFPGVVYTRTWQHSDWACTDCHMNEFDPVTKTGGHSLIPNLAKCAECHSADHIDDTQTAIDAKITELLGLLLDRGLFKQTTSSSGSVSSSAVNTHDFFGTLLPNLATPSATTYGMAINANTISATNGLVDYGSGTIKMAADNVSSTSTVGSSDRLGRKWSYGELGAAYNYMFINSELSRGVHNPGYAMKVLQSSIDWLNAN